MRGPCRIHLSHGRVPKLFTWWAQPMASAMTTQVQSRSTFKGKSAKAQGTHDERLAASSLEVQLTTSSLWNEHNRKGRGTGSSAQRGIALDSRVWLELWGEEGCLSLKSETRQGTPVLVTLRAVCGRQVDARAAAGCRVLISSLTVADVLCGVGPIGMIAQHRTLCSS